MDRVNVIGDTAVNMETARCAICYGLLSTHVSKDGFVCPEAKHPLRRESDAVTFVPLTNVVASNETPTTEQPAPAARTRKSTRKGASNRTTRGRATKRESRAKETRETSNDTGKRRGRIPGVYMPGDKEPEKLTESIGKVFKTVRGHKRGIGLRDISAKLDMPSGTVGWALQKLIKQKAVTYAAAVA